MLITDGLVGKCLSCSMQVSIYWDSVEPLPVSSDQKLMLLCDLCWDPEDERPPPYLHVVENRTSRKPTDVAEFEEPAGAFSQNRETHGD